MKGAIKFKNKLKSKLKDPEFRKAFEEEDVYSSTAIQIAKLRQKQGLTQGELAKLLHTTQQSISRLEDPGNSSLSVRTLVRIADILNKHLKIRFV